MHAIAHTHISNSSSSEFDEGKEVGGEGSSARERFRIVI